MPMTEGFETFPANWIRSDKAGETQTDVAMISRGERSAFAAMLELRLMMKLKMIASWLQFFHSVETSLYGSGTKLEREILSIRLFVRALHERRRLLKKIMLVVEVNWVSYFTDLGNVFSRRSFPKLLTAMKWMLSDSFLAFCPTKCRHRSWDREDWWTSKNQLRNSSSYR